MKYAVIYENKLITTQVGLVGVYDTEAKATAAAAERAKQPEYSYYICPTQTKVSGDVMIGTTVLAPTVSTAQLDSSVPALGIPIGTKAV